jgi:hypothetical protein
MKWSVYTQRPIFLAATIARIGTVHLSKRTHVGSVDTRMLVGRPFRSGYSSHALHSDKLLGPLCVLVV